MKKKCPVNLRLSSADTVQPCLPQHGRRCDAGEDGPDDPQRIFDPPSVVEDRIQKEVRREEQIERVHVVAWTQQGQDQRDLPVKRKWDQQDGKEEDDREKATFGETGQNADQHRKHQDPQQLQHHHRSDQLSEGQIRHVIHPEQIRDGNGRDVQAVQWKDPGRQPHCNQQLKRIKQIADEDIGDDLGDRDAHICDRCRDDQLIHAGALFHRKAVGTDDGQNDQCEDGDGAQVVEQHRGGDRTAEDSRLSEAFFGKQ